MRAATKWHKGVDPLLFDHCAANATHDSAVKQSQCGARGWPSALGARIAATPSQRTLSLHAPPTSAHADRTQHRLGSVSQHRATQTGAPARTARQHAARHMPSLCDPKGGLISWVSALRQLESDGGANPATKHTRTEPLWMQRGHGELRSGGGGGAVHRDAREMSGKMRACAAHGHRGETGQVAACTLQRTWDLSHTHPRPGEPRGRARREAAKKGGVYVFGSKNQPNEKLPLQQTARKKSNTINKQKTAKNKQ